MPQSTTASLVAVPAEVTEFAAQQGVAEQLLPVLDMTRRIFRPSDVSVEVNEDPEIAADRHIVVRANRVRLSVAEALEARWEWHRNLLALCPAPLMCVFRLGLQIDP